MRINLAYVNSYLVTALELRHATGRVIDNGVDLIVVELHNRERVALHLVERDIDLSLIRQTLTANTASGLATLFILSAPMLLPDRGMCYHPYDWMSALLSLYGDLIYGYEVFDAEAYFFPVYFDPIPNDYRKLIRYGDTVRMQGLHAKLIQLDTPILQGAWKIADFEGDSQYRSAPEQSPIGYPIEADYLILGLTTNADWDAIRTAYRDLARQYHPDVNDQTDSTAKMQQINAAYDRLRTHLGQV